MVLIMYIIKTEQTRTEPNVRYRFFVNIVSEKESITLLDIPKVIAIVEMDDSLVSLKSKKFRINV